MGHTESKRKNIPLAVTNLEGKVIEGVLWVYKYKKWTSKATSDVSRDETINIEKNLEVG